MTPRLLDLFCGAGGAAMGYHRAGFDVIGVDLHEQPYYPFKFLRGDALETLSRLVANRVRHPSPRHGLWGYYNLHDFAAIHASPPCQAHTTMSNRWRGSGGATDSLVSLIEPTRTLLEQTGLPWVIENVPGAKNELRSPVVINGPSVGLPNLDRPRMFESNIVLLVPERQTSENPIGVYGKAPDGRLLWRRADGTEQRAAKSNEEAGKAMGMDWADWHGTKEAIPPAYTELIGHQLIAALAAHEQAGT